MNRNELINNLKYLIDKYIPKERQAHFEPFFLMHEIPVKGILADFNELSSILVEEKDGALIREIYFYYC